MAVAYSRADISACAIHINMVPSTPAAPPVNFRFKIYAFCDVDASGMPQQSANEDVNTDEVVDHYCQCLSLPELATGCGTRHEALAVSVTVSSRFANAISISLTLYSQSPLNVP